MVKKVYIFKDDETMRRCLSLIEKGDKYREEHDWEEAFDSYNEAISLAPNMPNIYFGRGCTNLLIACIDKFLDQGEKGSIEKRLNEALEDFDREIDTSPDHPGYHLMRGITCKQLGRNQLAEEEFKKISTLTSEIDVEQKLSEYFKMVEKQAMVPTLRKIKIEAETLAEAEKQLQKQIPEGESVISKNIISDGQEKTIICMGDSIETAKEACDSKIPAGAEIIKRHDLIPPKNETLVVDDYNENDARQAVEKTLAEGASIVSSKLVRQGKKGFLGIGKSPNAYEISIDRKAVVECTVKSKAKIIAKIGQKPKPKCSKCGKASDELLDITLQDANTSRQQDVSLCPNCFMSLGG